MKPTNLIITILFSTVFQGISQDLTGTYENDCHEKLILRSDSTFYYAYPVGHGWNWATGSWEIQSEKLTLTTNPVLDTVDTTFELTLEGTDSVFDLKRSKKLKDPYLMTSIDTIIDNYNIVSADVLSVSCCGRQLIEFEQKFDLGENELTKLRNQDYPDCKKLKRITMPNKK